LSAALSSNDSAKSFFSRRFSSSRLLRRFASEISRLPYFDFHLKVKILGIDLAKNVFQLHGVDREGRPVLVRRVRREQLLRVIGELEPCLIGIEASTGAFYWQRQFEKLGHAVKIMAPQYVKPFVRRQKNDTNFASLDILAVYRGNPGDGRELAPPSR
jgi:transposase